MSKKKRLGRGLDALLSKPAGEAPAITGQDHDALKSLPVDMLKRGQYQPRVDMRQDSLEELASSIKSQGVVQPIVVRPLTPSNGEARYEIIAGERRWRAAQMAGIDEIPAVVRNVPDEAAIAMALIENIQREDLNPLEEARALDRLIREFDLTHQEAAEAVGRGRASVSNLLRLLDLSDQVKSMLEARQIEMGHARALLAIEDKGKQLEAAHKVVRDGMTVRETERFVRYVLEGAPEKRTKAAEPVNPDIRRLEVEVSDKLGAKVKIDHSKKGGGKLVINYNSLDELDGILQHIK